jgi:Fe-S cluster assembly iron-binding protein IscA
MLVLTPTAVEVVRTVTSAGPTPPSGGLRIATASGGPHDGALELSVAPAPADDDQVIAGPGVQVFLDRRAAAYLADKVLDAGLDDDGRASFVLGEQGNDGARPPTPD